MQFSPKTGCTNECLLYDTLHLSVYVKHGKINEITQYIFWHTQCLAHNKHFISGSHLNDDDDYTGCLGKGPKAH